MKIPTSIRVGAITYQVVFDGVADGNNNLGETSSMEQKIRLSDHMPASRLAQTLLHEIIHAVDLDRSHDLKEVQVRNLANGLCAILQDMGCWPQEFER